MEFSIFVAYIIGYPLISKFHRDVFVANLYVYKADNF